MMSAGRTSFLFGVSVMPDVGFFAFCGGFIAPITPITNEAVASYAVVLFICTKVCCFAFRFGNWPLTRFPFSTHSR